MGFLNLLKFGPNWVEAERVEEDELGANPKTGHFEREWKFGQWW